MNILKGRLINLSKDQEGMKHRAKRKDSLTIKQDKCTHSWMLTISKKEWNLNKKVIQEIIL
jgi:hypothetical protein